MLEAWRIVKEKHAAMAFSGEGAARNGGRWNSCGVRVVYASSTRSLATLETLVHLNPPVFFKYVAFRIQFEPVLLEKMLIHCLPPGWRAEPPGQSSKLVGDQWVREARSAVLELPSVLVSGEPNYLLNPAHPDFKSIVIGGREPFGFDPRLVS